MNRSYSRRPLRSGLEPLKDAKEKISFFDDSSERPGEKSDSNEESFKYGSKDDTGSPEMRVLRKSKDDDTFDKLFKGAKNCYKHPAYRQVTSSFDESPDITESSDNSVCLFASITEHDDGSPTKRRPRKKNSPKIGRRVPSDRLFSESTLNYAIGSLDLGEDGASPKRKSASSTCSRNEGSEENQPKESEKSARQLEENSHQNYDCSKERSDLLTSPPGDANDHGGISNASPDLNSEKSQSDPVESPCRRTGGMTGPFSMVPHLTSTPIAQTNNDSVISAMSVKGGKNWRRRTTMAFPSKSVRRRTCIVNLRDESYQLATDNQPVQVLTDLDKVLSRCNEFRVMEFGELFNDHRLLLAKKVGEGAFGEVFLMPDPDAPNEVDPPVVKIVPVDGQAQVNGQLQTHLADMLAEIVISTELGRLSAGLSAGPAPGFLRVSKCSLVRAPAYPTTLLEAWDMYDDEKGSENDRPDAELFAAADQKFVILELANGGSDLEKTTLANASQGLAIILQVAHALAVAERVYKFEHRDLHWGNILVRDTKERTVSYELGPDNVLDVETAGVRATIIDFSLSRMTIDGGDVYNNLAEDEDLFKAHGDYQFDIYRMMRSHTEDRWKSFHPKTNVMWLHYLLDKMASEVAYKNKKAKVHRSAMAKIRQLKATALECESAFNFVVSCLAD